MSNLKKTVTAALATGLLAGAGYATPSTTYWTPATTPSRS